MNVMTDAELIECGDANEVMTGRNVEAAVIKSLAAGVSVEPFRTDADGEEVYVIHQLNTAIAAARVQALEDAATLIESTELSGLNNDIQLQVFVGKMLIGYCKAIRALIGKEST